MLRNVRKNDRGDDVLSIQQGLNQRLNNLVPPIPNLKRRPQDGLFLEEDGKFGNETEGVVKAFQRRMKLVDDGVVGYHTRKALFPLGLATVNLFMLRMPELRVPGLGRSPSLGQPLPPFRINLAAFIPPLGAAGLVAVRIPGFPGSLMGPPVIDLQGRLPILLVLLGGLALPGSPGGT